MSFLIIAGFLGGMLRGILGFVDHKEKRIAVSYLIFAIVAEGVIGIMFSLMLLYTGLITVAGFTAQFIVMIVAGYAGADVVNSIYTMLHRKRFIY